MRDTTVSADGLVIHYAVQGQGSPALVFIHGWCCNHRHWQAQLDHFAPHYTVVAVDLGGHGDSGQNRTSWTMAAFAEDVVAVIEKLGLDRVILVGHSMGGTVSVEVAQRLPERVIGIVGVDTFKKLLQTRTQAEIDATMDPFRANFAQTADSFVRTGMFAPTTDATFMDKIAADMVATPPQVAISAAEQLFRHDVALRAGLEAVNVPVVLINSDFRPTDTQATARFGITIEAVSGVGHFVMLEDAAAFNAILEKTVQRLVAERVAGQT